MQEASESPCLWKLARWSDREGYERLLFENLLAAQPLARLGRHLGGILHNLTGRLQNLELQVELLQWTVRDGGRGIETQKEEEQLRRLAAGVDDLREVIHFWGRQADLESQLRPGPVNINQVIEEALIFLEANLFYKHQVTTEVNLEPGLPPVHGSVFAYGTAFGALLENNVDAMRASPEKRLLVSSRKEGDKVIVAFEDTGLGAVRGRELFVPRPSPKKDHPLYGGILQRQLSLGLCLANRVLQPWGALITWDDRPAGAIFAVHIPIASSRPIDWVTAR